MLIAAVYINFLRQIDVFEKERKRYTLYCFLMGMAFLFLLYPMHFFIPVSHQVPADGSIINLFIFHLFNVAVFEETVKILPFLVILLKKDVINEPFDYIKYASVGAMGFAAVENIDYFNRYSIHIIEGRAFYTAILHMFTSSTIAYMVMARKNLKLSALTAFVIGFVLAVITHALFNTLVSGEATYYFGMALVIGILVVWGRMMNNGLNNSPFFNDSSTRKLVFRAAAGLFIGWLGVFVFAAVAISIHEGLKEGLDFISEGFIFLLLSGAGLFIGLGRPDIRKGEWYPLFRRRRK